MDCKLAKVNSKSGQYGANAVLVISPWSRWWCKYSAYVTSWSMWICKRLLPFQYLEHMFSTVYTPSPSPCCSWAWEWGWAYKYFPVLRLASVYCSKSSIGRKASILPNTTSPVANLPEKVTACCCYGRSLHPLVRECTSYLDDQCIQLHKYSPYECLHNTLRDRGSSSYAISFTTSDLWFVSNLEVLLPWKNVPREPVLVSKRWE